MKKEFKAVDFKNVKIMDSFWIKKIEINQKKTVFDLYKKLKETGRIDAFKLDWKKGKKPIPHIFWDSDVYKWIEGASYILAKNPDSKLKSLVNKVISLIVKAQQEDGYLNVYFTVVEPQKRWTNLRDCHELYCAGHLFEAAVAHFNATGEQILLNVARRYADYIDSVFGRELGKKRGYCGHPEIELALIKLYQVTGERRYLYLSKYFVEERGRKPYYFDIEAKLRKETPKKISYSYYQAHMPVRKQTVAVGHAVRAMYLYSAMADLAAEFNDEELLHVCKKLWKSVCERQMYITGGIGSTADGERFTYDFDLPNETAYAETCANIGLVFWNHRLLQIDCENKYADIMERALYNSVISGVSLDGTKYFYVNPLESRGKHHRQEMFDCACCPPNLLRFLASLGQYIYSQNEEDVAIHLYIGSIAKLNIKNQNVILLQKTNYPWDGEIKIRINTKNSVNFGIRLRIPSWCDKYNIWINKEKVKSVKIKDGYAILMRNWKNNDVITLILSMSIKMIRSNPNIKENIGRVALQRGPIVYCLEEVDNKVPLYRILLPEKPKLKSIYKKDLLNGVVIIKGDAFILDDSNWKNKLYLDEKNKLKPFKFTAIPYYAWDNRKPGEMRVWLNTLKNN